MSWSSCPLLLWGKIQWSFLACLGQINDKVHLHQTQHSYCVAHPTACGYSWLFSFSQWWETSSITADLLGLVLARGKEKEDVMNIKKILNISLKITAFFLDSLSSFFCLPLFWFCSSWKPVKLSICDLYLVWNVFHLISSSVNVFWTIY